MPKSKRTTTTAKRRLEFYDDHQQDINAAASVIVVEKENETKLPTTTDGIDIKQPPSIVMATPEKKKSRRGDESDGNRDRKKGIVMYFSPSKTTAIDTRETSVLVTPEKKEEEDIEQETKDERKIQQHVPIYIHKNLNYQRRGEAFLNEKLKHAFDLVEEHYVIPSDFESDRSYGPLSGTCFEERAVNAYDRGLLLASPDQPTIEGNILICTHCAELGHRQDDCQDLI